MGPMEEIITEALCGTTSKDIGLCRVACNAAASSAMFCPDCGNVLDQSRVYVVTVKTPKRRVVAPMCNKCWAKDKDRILSAAKDTHTPILVEHWSGVIFSQGSVD